MSTLSEALIAGEESGPATPFDFDEFIAKKVGSTQHPPPAISLRPRATRPGS